MLDDAGRRHSSCESAGEPCLLSSFSRDPLRLHCQGRACIYCVGRVLSSIAIDGCRRGEQIALPPAPDSPFPSIVPTLYTDYLVLLRDQRLGILFLFRCAISQTDRKFAALPAGWRVMSKIFSASSLHDPFTSPPNLPSDFAEVAGSIPRSVLRMCYEMSDTEKGCAMICPVLRHTSLCCYLGTLWDGYRALNRAGYQLS